MENNQLIVTEASTTTGLPSTDHVISEASTTTGLPSTDHVITEASTTTGLPSTDHVNTEASTTTGLPSTDRVITKASTTTGLPSTDHVITEASTTTGLPFTDHVPSEYASDSGTTLGGGLPAPDHAPAEIKSNSDMISVANDFTLNSDAMDTSNPADLDNNAANSIAEAVPDGAYEPATNDRVAGSGEDLAVLENIGGLPVHAVGHDGSNEDRDETSNFYHYAGVIENGSVVPNEEGGPVVEQFEQVYSAEEERLWNMVRANCLDFNSWTTLIEETEKVEEGDLFKIRKVYDAFLAEFPLCFGYWKKYADHEGRWNSVEKVMEVYERAVLAVTYSVDIWLHYCVFAISTVGDSDAIRRLFERGLAYVGTDYLSYPLWDEYIRYEESHQNWCHLAMIYTRILENPIQQLDRYFSCFKELAASQPLVEILTSQEAAMVAPTMEVGTEGVHGEIHHDDAEQSSKPVSAGLQEAEELGKYIAIREEMYKKAKEFDSKIIGFETAIRRPYFHVKPLDDPELDNWHNYLDFIERGDDFNKVVKLYERCLIACANYPKYWIRYVLCMEASGSMELALNALARATLVFVKKQPEIHLFAARFRELSGDISGARAEFQLLYSEISPCLLEAIVKHANMEYRLGNKDDAFAVYEKIIASEQEKEQSKILSMLLVQYSRFLYLVTDNVQKATEVLDGALEHVQLSKPLLEAVIHLKSIQPSPKLVDHLDSLVEKFITPNPDNPNIASTSDREEISCIFLEFLDLFGDANAIKKAENRHNMLFLRQKSMSLSKKRHAEDFLVSEKAKMLATGTGVPLSGPSVLGSYLTAQNQWPSNTEVKASAWPTTSQAQTQQWTPGYSQQADYSAYAVPSYSHPQIPTSAPQPTAYAPYPPTYPVQAYPPQSYAQPAVASFPQPAVASQQYYGGSYY